MFCDPVVYKQMSAFLIIQWQHLNWQQFNWDRIFLETKAICETIDFRYEGDKIKEIDPGAFV